METIGNKRKRICQSMERRTRNFDLERRTRNFDLENMDPVETSLDHSSLHSDGYIIFKNAIDVRDEILEELKSQVNKKVSIIFNRNELTGKNDRKRLQCDLNYKEQFMEKFIEQISEFINGKINDDRLTFNNWTILYSKQGCQRQAPHTDYVADDQFIKSMTYANQKNKGLIPLLVLISVMPETYLNIWEKSIGLITTEQVDFKDRPKIESKKLMLNKGDIVIFRADLIHAGSDYDKENIRLHVYLDSPIIDRRPNMTWLIHKHANAELSNIII